MREAVLETAKNELVEAMAPALKKLLEQTIRGNKSMPEGANRLRRGVQDNYPGESHTNFEEGKDKGDASMDDNQKDMELDLESLAGFFPQLAELGMSDEEQPGMELPAEGAPADEMSFESQIPMLGEEPKMDDEEEGDMDEEVEISEAELRKVYEAALQTEVEVKKGFGEMTKAGELDAVAKDVDKGLADVKKGESGWDTVEPPAKQDFTVKEMIRRGMQENKQLRENLGKAAKMIRVLGTRLHEVNLFNSKVLHVNRILNGRGRLTTEQKKVVMESIDKARSVQEVKMVYETIVGSFKASQPLSESKVRKPSANAQRARSSGSPDQKVLRESADRGNGDGTVNRWKQLAGLVK